MDSNDYKTGSLKNSYQKNSNQNSSKKMIKPFNTRQIIIESHEDSSGSEGANHTDDMSLHSPIKYKTQEKKSFGLTSAKKVPVTRIKLKKNRNISPMRSQKTGTNSIISPKTTAVGSMVYSSQHKSTSNSLSPTRKIKGLPIREVFLKLTNN